MPLLGGRCESTTLVRLRLNLCHFPGIFSERKNRHQHASLNYGFFTGRAIGRAPFCIP